MGGTAIGSANAMEAYRIGGWWLAVPAFVAGFLLLPSIATAVGFIDSRIYPERKRMPACTCGDRDSK